MKWKDLRISESSIEEELLRRATLSETFASHFEHLEKIFYHFKLLRGEDIFVPATLTWSILIRHR